MKNLLVHEQVVKTVVRSGNGGAVWVPKGWLGEEVTVILPKKPRLGIKERIFHALEPHLKDVVAVALYGSYARGENTGQSDVDVLVITGNKPLHILSKGLDILAIPAASLKKNIENHPAVFYQMLRESVPLINASAFEEFKKIRVTRENFMRYLSDTKDHVKSSEELLALDALGGAYITSFSILYSVMLRLKGLFIAKCILGREPFSNKKFKAWIINQGITEQEYEDSHAIYRIVRDGSTSKVPRVTTQAATRLLALLKKQVRSFEEGHDQ